MSPTRRSDEEGRVGTDVEFPTRMKPLDGRHAIALRAKCQIFSEGYSFILFYSYSDLAGEPCRTSRYILFFPENL